MSDGVLCLEKFSFILDQGVQSRDTKTIAVEYGKEIFFCCFVFLNHFCCSLFLLLLRSYTITLNF